MPTLIPFFNKEPGEVAQLVHDRIYDHKAQRRLVLVTVCIALLLDNMLYMVIVPIIPDYLQAINAWGPPPTPEPVPVRESIPPPILSALLSANSVSTDSQNLANDSFLGDNFTTPIPLLPNVVYPAEDSAVGFLFASKAIIQLLVNPFTGHIIDRIGYDLPMMIGLSIIFVSTAIFAFGQSYGVLFMARSLQGLGSAFADTSGLAMIADRFTEESERTKALGIALAFISFGCLFAPPFGGILYQFAGKKVPFLLLATIALVDGFILMMVMKPIRKATLLQERPRGTPIYKLIIDPYIAVCAGALVMANVSLAFLEPTIAIWMRDNMDADQWEMGLIWLPAFFPHVLGVYTTVKIAKKYPQYQWLIGVVGLTLEGISCLFVPFCKSFPVLMVPISGICFGIALVDTALLPMLGYLVDVRHVSVYGSIYAIADISYSLAYAFGPIVAGSIVQSIGFTWLNVGIFFSNILYAPIMYSLRHIYDYKTFENEDENDLPPKDTNNFNSYQMNNIDGTQLNEDGKATINTELQTERPKNANGPTNPFVADQRNVTNGHAKARFANESDSDY